MSEPRRKLSILVPELPWLKAQIIETQPEGKGEESSDLKAWREAQPAALVREAGKAA